MQDRTERISTTGLWAIPVMSVLLSKFILESGYGSGKWTELTQNHAQWESFILGVSIVASAPELTVVYEIK